MRILITGAGALGGYFGGRLLEAHRDVTFLVRPRRAAELQATGLVIQSPLGDAKLPAPPHLLAHEIAAPFDVVMVACKAYNLTEAMESFAPAIGPETVILPLLNGMSHLDQLAARFGGQHVLGGVCFISATLGQGGTVLHLNDMHTLDFGERNGSISTRVDAIAKAFNEARFDSHPSEQILQEMWEKWIFIAATAGITCLMRASIGDIVASGGSRLAEALLEECAAIASGAGFPPSSSSLQRSRAILTAPGSGIAASMLRDIERGAPTEADHILGDLLRREGTQGGSNSLLSIAYTHLKAYEARRERQADATSNRITRL